MTTGELEAAGQAAFAVEFRDGSTRLRGEGSPAFTILVADEAQWQWFLKADVYSAAMAFVRGDFEVRGDLVAAIRFFKDAAARKNWKHWLLTVLERVAPHRIEAWFQTRSQAAHNIRFHYDRSNDFYTQFLDSRMQYSSAYFRDPAWSLEEAQLAKLDLICTKLALRPGERFLDVGCGWGGLLIHAAERYGVEAVGCTLSRRQHEYATAAVAERGLSNRVAVREMDYRELEGRFHKIASIGMFEHVGRRRLREYFRKIGALLEDGGLFLNAGMTRPQFVKNNPETLFSQRKVFPGGELVPLGDVVREAENCGFDVLHLEDLRDHYARTAREWVRRLQQNREACLRLVDAETYRVWLLYLSNFILNFERGLTGMYDVLLAKRRG
jgi:cyclopropane-fatty-acyl-phospholipid synthase